MRVYDTKESMSVLFYLLTIDGTTDEEELNRFSEIGVELDRKNFDSYKDEIVASCQKRISLKEPEDDYYDVILEGVDGALRHMAKGDDCGVTARLLVWNMLAVAYSNREYDTSEKKLIAHVARVSDVPRDILLEMEQIMQSALAVQNQLAFVQALDRPYSEVRPMVDNLEKRLSVIIESGKALIEDEMLLDNPFEYQPDMLDKAKESFDVAMAPVKEKLGETANTVGHAALDAGGVAADKVGGALKGLFGKMKSAKTSKEDK